MIGKRTLLTFALLLSGSAWAQPPGLLEIYRMAQESDPQIRAERASVAAVHEQRRQALGFYLPELGAGADHTRWWRDPSGAPESRGTSRGWSVTLNQPILRLDYLARIRQADAGTGAAEARLLAAEHGLAVRVAERYFNVLAAQDSLELANAELRAIERQLEQTRQRFEVGLVAITEVREAEARYDQTQAQLLAAENGLAVAREALREIVGHHPEALAQLDPEARLPAPEPSEIDAWVGFAVEHNPSLAAARHALDIAHGEVRTRRAGHLPTLEATARYSDSRGDSNFVGNERSVGLQLRMPLYAGGRIAASVREGEHRLTEAYEQVDQALRAVEFGTRAAYLGVVSGKSRVRALERAVTSSETALEATEAGFEVGTRTIVDVLNAQQQLFHAQRDLAEARYAVILDSLRLKQAAGTLDDDDIAAIDHWLR